MDTNTKLFMAADKKEVNEKERTVVAWASKPVIDRHNEMITWNAWDTKAFEKNHVLLVAHNYAGLPAGKVQWLKKTKEGLKFKAEFAETALGDELFYLYANDFMNAFSVGFIPKKWVDGESLEKGDDGYGADVIYTKAELLEISCVTVPACSEALATAYNSGKIQTKSMLDLLEKEKIINVKEDMDAEIKEINEDLDGECSGIVDKQDAEQKKDKYNCECVECGWKITTEKHCKDIKCDKCGSEMRRVERPGPGKDVTDIENDDDKENQSDYIIVPEEPPKLTTEDIAKLIERIEELENKLETLNKTEVTETETEITDKEDGIIEIIESEEVNTEETEIKVSEVQEALQKGVDEIFDTIINRKKGKVLVRDK